MTDSEVPPGETPIEQAAVPPAPEPVPGAAPEASAPTPAPVSLPEPSAQSAAELDGVEPAAIEQAAEDEEPDTPFDKLVSRARRFSSARVATMLESLLLVADKPLTPDAIRACTGLEPSVIQEGLQKLQGFYRDGVRGIVLTEVAGGWQLRTCPSTSEFVRRFLKVKPQRLTRAALETLAIIAYRQPVTRPEIEDIRAVDSGALLKALLDRGLVRILGKKEEPGRPLLYGTSVQFLEFFNLKDLASLPTLREFQELTEENREIVEKETGPAEEAKGTEGLVADLADKKLEERLQASTTEADAALADLETALADTDSKSKATARVLNPLPPPPASPDGTPPPAAPAPAAEDDGEAEDEQDDGEGEGEPPAA